MQLALHTSQQLRFVLRNLKPMQLLPAQIVI
jgi:hypothetical protein